MVVVHGSVRGTTTGTDAVLERLFATGAPIAIRG
jgi:hypothetical protein